MITIQRITRHTAALALALPMAAFAAATSFDSMDKNHDGSISRAEYDAAHKAGAAGSSSALPSRSIEERSKGMVHSQEQGSAARGNSGASSGASATTQTPSRDIEERSKGIAHQK
jgi:hypothetical protein